jgi:uncharacterized 2Fe-2S/4Fe-4S cluster protein (DUF4445 family)
VRNSGKNQIINVQAGDTTAQNYAVAMDIGTTTVFGQLVDLVSGQALAEHGEFNGQISYGEDVISRIMFAEKPGGLATMQQVVIATVNKVLGHLLKQSKVSRENISLITFAGWPSSRASSAVRPMCPRPRSIRPSGPPIWGSIWIRM